MFPQIMLILSMFGLFQSDTFNTSHSKDKIFLGKRFTTDSFKIKIDKEFDELISRFEAQQEHIEKIIEEIQLSQRHMTFNLSLSSIKFESLELTENFNPRYKALPQDLSPVQIIEGLQIFRKSENKISEFAKQRLITETVYVFFLDLGIIGVMICFYLTKTRKL